MNCISCAGYRGSPLRFHFACSFFHCTVQLGGKGSGRWDLPCCLTLINVDGDSNTFSNHLPTTTWLEEQCITRQLFCGHVQMCLNYPHSVPLFTRSQDPVPWIYPSGYWEESTIFCQNARIAMFKQQKPSHVLCHQWRVSDPYSRSRLTVAVWTLPPIDKMMSHGRYRRFKLVNANWVFCKQRDNSPDIRPPSDLWSQAM